ncbi:MAG: hypothetical protein D6679_14435 [Candidatus Hydrogenedentota bacterium]|nr:MAG: hypothetical protein D6679_14435 [Candidatus Hydrogenedentota bacterium]
MTRLKTFLLAAILAVFCFVLVSFFFLATAAEWNPIMKGRALAGLGGLLLLVFFLAFLPLFQKLRRLEAEEGEIARAILQDRVPGSKIRFLEGIATAWRNTRETQLRRSEEREATVKRNRLELRLARAGMVSAELTHEMRTPLTVIRGRAELILESIHRGETPSEEDAREILEQSRLCGELTEALLHFVREEKIEKAAVRFDSLSIGAQRAEVVTNWGREAEAVIGDRRLLELVFRNLVRNAEEAGAKRIVIQSERAADCVRIFIRDDGRGISAEVKKTLFEPFTSGRSGGTGLGLAISRDILRAHGGEITATNRPEGGAEFQLILPRKGGEA